MFGVAWADRSARKKAIAAVTKPGEGGFHAWLKIAPDDTVTIYSPVPPGVARVANVERMQMLVESPSRVALQRMLGNWLPMLHALRNARRGDDRILRWAVDVDPLTI